MWIVETLLLLPLVIGVLFCAIFSDWVIDALSRSAIVLLRKMAGCFTLNRAWRSVSIPHGAMGRSAVCDYHIFWSYSLVESICLLEIQIGLSLLFFKS